METDLLALRNLDRSAQRDWLMANMPSDRSRRVNWWLALITRASRNASWEHTRSDERASWVALTLVVLQCSLDSGCIDADEVAIGRAYLSNTLRAYDDPSRYSPSLRAESVVSECLERVGEKLSYERILRLIDEWQEKSVYMDVKELHILRKVKTLLQPIVYHVDYLRDASLASEARKWTKLINMLP